MGFDIADPFFLGAGDVGAPHSRKRVFLLAYRNGDGPEGQRRVRSGGAVGRGEIPDAERDEVRDESERGEGPAREAERGHPIAGDLGLFPPGPDDLGTWAGVLSIAPHLEPAIEPEFRCVVDGVSVVLDESRADQIRCAGNAVVVAQAYVAFRQLLRWIGGTDD